jgi:hypothetical protein
MKAVKAKLAETNPDRVAAFEKGAAAFAKKIVANFGDYEFYTGESMDPDGMVALLNYRVRGSLALFPCSITLTPLRSYRRTVPPLTSPSGRTGLRRSVFFPSV